MASMTYREFQRLLVDHGCRYLGTRTVVGMKSGFGQAASRLTSERGRDSPENVEGCWHQGSQYLPSLLTVAGHSKRRAEERSEFRL
jgi:hypothetical protein